MNLEQLLVGGTLFVIGGLNVVRPDLYINFQVWVQKKIMKAEYIPSDRTYNYVRILGAVFIVLGLLNLVGSF